ncbi:S-adenosyl-l-methionine hydroxide adenosyltransferase family protein [Flavobacterium sp.]|uniref:SAM hydrolase/SAM-dependent halogenase family protein n=1 Tax=Flavobacterium sp. TaxID=239 RepID=UPI0035299D13
MSIITLTTDFGYKDYFVGATKGKILKQCPSVTIVDISHEIEKFNISEASYCIESAYKSFPDNTIHIIDVDSDRINTNYHVAIQWNNQYFIGANNGVFSNMLAKSNAEKIVALTSFSKTVFDIDVFVSAACYIANGGKLTDLGNEIFEITKLNEFAPQINTEQTTIKGHIIYIDDFGNCITNISKEMFKNVGKNRAFEITFRNKTITSIKSKYSDFVTSDKYLLKDFEGERLALFNENNLLEIAIYKSNPKTVGSAATLLGLKNRDLITINFK